MYVYMQKTTVNHNVGFMYRQEYSVIKKNPAKYKS